MRNRISRFLAHALLSLMLLVGALALDHRPAGAVEVALLESNDQLVRIGYQVGDFSTEKVKIDRSDYYRVLLGHEPNSMERGMPDVPFICRSIIIPENAKMELQVVESGFVEHHMPIAPSKGFVSRDVNPDEVPYQFSEEYNSDRFYPQDLAELGSPYVLRDFRGITVTVYPFRYNPRTQTLRVYTHLVVEVRSLGIDEENVKFRRSGECNSHFADIYENHFLNYESHKYGAVGEHGRMIVISSSDFMDGAELYVDWKRQKGIPTDLYDVATIGTTADDIKAFIQTEYDLGDGLTFVQLVGDYEHVPSFLIARDFCDGLATSDASYSLLEGSDSYPDILVGRFSAADVFDIRTQVLRTIWYERDVTGGDWLHKGTCVGSAWGEGYGYMGLRDRELVEVLRLMLLGYTYTEVDQLYEYGEPPFGIIPVPVTEYMNAINEGKGIVIIEGHADCEASFQIPPGTPTPGDIFTTDSIYLLTNDYMLPVMSIGAPYLGNFQIDEAFSEAWLRATNNVTGDPIGAIAVYASSVDLDYASPQAAQHEMTELLVNDMMNTVGGLMYNGACHSIDLYGARGEKTFQSYHIFGDVSLQMRTDTPEGMTVEHAPNIAAGSSSFEVTVVGVQGALCAVSRNYQLLGFGYTDTSGYAIIGFDQPVPAGTPLDLVVTAYNKITYSAQITVTSGGFLAGDANGDWIVDVADVVYLVNFLYKGGDPPDPMEAGDANCDGIVNVGDIVYLVNYLYKAGPPPCTPPIGSLTGHQGCKEFSKGGAADSIPQDQDCMVYQYDGESVLLLEHINAGFNCCPDEILADVSIQGNVITITEDESLEPGGGCDCLCLFDTDYRIDNLPPGEYTIRVYGMYLLGAEILELTVDLASSSSGMYCVHRDFYPWGIR